MVAAPEGCESSSSVHTPARTNPLLWFSVTWPQSTETEKAAAALGWGSGSPFLQLLQRRQEVQVQRRVPGHSALQAALLFAHSLVSHSKCVNSPGVVGANGHTLTRLSPFFRKLRYNGKRHVAWITQLGTEEGFPELR